jgi:hypothetical protein
MEGIAGIEPRELERRRERVRRAWAYRRVDHLPLGFILEDTSRYTVRELCQSGQKQLEVNIRSIDRLLRLLPDDYLPAARLWPGYMTIATMFGLTVHWGEDPMQPPGVREHPIRDLSQVYGLTRPDPRTSGLMPFVITWTREFARVLPPEVCLAGPDLGGPLNTAKDLFDTNLLFTAFYDDPQAFRRFLELAAELQAACYREVIAAAGGLERLTCIDFDPLWAPEGHKGFVSDDVCAGLSPEHFVQFSRPYNNRLFREWPGGRLHNCGPHPAAAHYLGHDPPLDGLNCSFRYTRAELPRLREAFGGRGIVELMFDNGESAGEIARGYEEAVGALAPEVVAVPVVWLTHSWTDGDIRDLYEDLRRVAERAAGEFDWVGGD